MRLLVSAVDVLHSWTIPSFGLKIDACPGRLNQVNLFVKRFGVFLVNVVKYVVSIMGLCQLFLLTLPTSQYHYLVMTSLESHSD
jgi:hypothetical protein